MCRGQAYDGAATTMGSKTGVGTRINEIEPRAIVVHCQVHSLNLVVQDATANVRQATEQFYEQRQRIVQFSKKLAKTLS